MTFRLNLILVSKLSQKGTIITFIRNKVIIQDNKEKEVVYQVTYLK